MNPFSALSSRWWLMNIKDHLSSVMKSSSTLSIHSLSRELENCSFPSFFTVVGCGMYLKVSLGYARSSIDCDDNLRIQRLLTSPHSIIFIDTSHDFNFIIFFRLSCPTQRASENETKIRRRCCGTRNNRGEKSRAIFSKSLNNISRFLWMNF